MSQQRQRDTLALCHTATQLHTCAEAIWTRASRALVYWRQQFCEQTLCHVEGVREENESQAERVQDMRRTSRARYLNAVLMMSDSHHCLLKTMCKAWYLNTREQALAAREIMLDSREADRFELGSLHRQLEYLRAQLEESCTRIEHLEGQGAETEQRLADALEQVFESEATAEKYQILWAESRALGEHLKGLASESLEVGVANKEDSARLRKRLQRTKMHVGALMLAMWRRAQASVFVPFIYPL